MAAKKKSKGQAAKKGTKKPAAAGGGKAKLQAAADRKAGKPGASLAAYCRDILTRTAAAN